MKIKNVLEKNRFYLLYSKGENTYEKIFHVVTFVI